MKISGRKKTEPQKPPVVGDIARTVSRPVLDLKKKLPAIQINKAQITAWWFAHQHKFFIVASIIIGALVLSSFSTGHASVATFYPQSCLGDWERVDNAQGAPSLPNESSPQDFSTDNSARMSGTVSSIYCGSFTGEIPENANPKTFKLTFSWSVEDKDSSSIRTEPQPFDIPAQGIVIPAQEQDSSTIEQQSVQESVPAQEPSSESATVSFFKHLFTTRVLAQESDPTPPIVSEEVSTQSAQEEAPAVDVSSSAEEVVGTADTIEAQDASVPIEEVVTESSSGTVSDGFMEVSYTLDGTTWNTLGTISRSEWKRASFEIPLEKWENLSTLQVALKTLPTFDALPTVYLDAVKLDVEYTDMENVPTKPTVVLKDADSLISGKDGFNPTEDVTFTLETPNYTTEDIKSLVQEGKADVVKDTAGVLGEKVDDPERTQAIDNAVNTIQQTIDTTKELILSPPASLEEPQNEPSPVSMLRSLIQPTVAEAQTSNIQTQILDDNGNPADIPVSVVTDTTTGKRRVQIDRPDRSFRPGRYTLVVTVTTPQAILVSQQDFSWGVLAINTDMSVYRPGTTAYLQMGVLNDGGHTICNADLDLIITTPSGSVVRKTTDDESIVRAPECGPNNVISVPDYFAYYTIPGEQGVYTMRLTAHTANGTKQITDTFSVQSDLSIAVARTGPTRIYPVALYPMTLRVTSDTAWEGTVTERVPASFDISLPQQSQAYDSVTEDGDTKLITWDVSISAGETVQLGYYFNAPDISPEFYLLGPAVMTGTSSFEEDRQWQIASDAACNATATGTWSATASFVNCTGAASGGSGTGNRPGVNDTLTINSGVVVTADTTVTIKSLTFAASTVAAGLSVSNGVTFTVTGTTSIPSPGAAVANTITVGGGTSGTFSTAGITITGSATASRNSVLALSAGSTFTTTAGITFAGTAAQAQITNAGASTINLTGTMSTGGTVTINAGTALNTTGTVTLSRATTFGILNVNSGTTTMGAVAITYAGLVTVANSATLTTSSATGTKTFSAGITVNSGGIFDLRTGSNFAAVTSFGGNITANGTTFDSGGGAVTLTGTGTRTISGSGNVSLGGTVTVPTNMTLTNSNTGTVTMGALTIASPVASNGLSLTTGSTTNVTGAVTYTANATANTQTITMNGTANITAGSLTINRPTSTGQSNITCAASATGTFATTGAATINGASTATATVNITMNTCSFTSGGLLTIAGGTTGGNITFTTTTGVLTASAGVTFTGTAARNVLNIGSGNFNLTGTLGSGGTLTFDSANTLYTTGTAAISGAYTIRNFTVSSGTTTLNNVAITFAGNTVVSGSLVCASATGLKTFTGTVTVNSGGSFDLSAVATTTRFDSNITVDSTGTFNSGTGAVTMGTSLSLLGAGNISLGGTVTVNSGVTLTNSNTGTVTMGALTLASPTASNGLSLTTGSTTSVTGAITYTANATANTQTITMNGTANITAGSLTINRPTSTGQSNITCASGATGTFATSGAMSLQGANSGITASINLSMKDCTLSSGGLITWGGVSGGGTINVSFDSGTLTAGAGVNFVGISSVNFLTLGANSTLNLTGAIPANATISANATSTLVATGTSSITGAYTFGNLEVPSGTLSLGGVAITFAGTTTIDGALAVTSGTGTKTFTGLVTINPGGSFDLSAFSTASVFGGGITMNGATFTSGAGTTTFNTSQDLAGSSNMSFGGAVTIASGATLTNNNTGLVNFVSSVTGGNASSTFATGSGSTTEFDSTVMSTGTLVPSTSTNTVIYGGSTQTIKTPTTNPYFNLTIATAGTKSLAAATTVSGTTTVSAGTLDTVSGQNYAFTTGNLTISGTGTVLGQGATITLTGNWANTGTFTAGTSTVVMNGATTATVSGATTFNNLTITHTAAKEVQFQTSGSPIFTVSGLFTVTGSLGNLIRLRSDSSGTQWKFHPTGTASVSYVDVQDSACESGSIFLNPTNLTNSGNNGTCWINASITFSISDATIGFGTLSATGTRYATGDAVGSGTETEAHTITVNTTAPSGYSLTVRGGSLGKTGYTIAPIGGTNTAPSIGSEQFGLRLVASGGSGTVSSPYAASGFAYGANATTTSQVASASSGDGVDTTYSARYMCNISPTTPAGSYATDLTYVVTGNF